MAFSTVRAANTVRTSYEVSQRGQLHSRAGGIRGSGYGGGSAQRGNEVFLRYFASGLKISSSATSGPWCTVTNFPMLPAN
jgi:hypothetical protein